MNDDISFPSAADLETLDASLDHALRTGDVSQLALLGYGEISCVLQFSRLEQSFACKRLPVFQNEAALDAYAAVFDEYLQVLRSRGTTPTPSRLVTLEGPGNHRRVYCVQPKLDGAALLPQWMKFAEDEEVQRIFLQIVDRIEDVACGDVGIDGQISNWAVVEGQLSYLDVTTPLLRDTAGAERLDMDLFLASLPWALRFPVKKLMLREILDKYYVPRGIVLDLLGNLLKEKLDEKIPHLLEALGNRFSPRLTEKEIRLYYTSDASTWALLQRLRRMDRAWQTTIRRRTYPFLLPGPIER